MWWPVSHYYYRQRVSALCFLSNQGDEGSGSLGRSFHSFGVPSPPTQAPSSNITGAQETLWKALSH